MTIAEPITAQAIKTSPKGVSLILSDRIVTISWIRCSPRLAAATPAQCSSARLSPGGYGIHWPLLDEDLSVSGLVQRSQVEPGK